MRTKTERGERRKNCIIRRRLRESHTTCTTERTGPTCHLQGMPQIGIVPVVLGPQSVCIYRTLQTLNSRETGFAIKTEGRSKPDIRGSMYLREGNTGQASKEVLSLARKRYPKFYVALGEAQWSGTHTTQAVSGARSGAGKTTSPTNHSSSTRGPRAQDVCSFWRRRILSLPSVVV